MNFRDTEISSNRNVIHVTGSSTIEGDIRTGNIDLYLNYRTLMNAAGDEVEGPTIYTNGNLPDYTNKNAIVLTGTTVEAIDNTITIQGNHTFTGSESSIFLGSISANPNAAPQSYDVFSGNTLNYANKTPIQLAAIGNFQEYNFVLSPELANKSEALITTNQITLGTNESNVSSDKAAQVSDIYVTGIHSGKILETNTKFILMQAAKDKLIGVGRGHLSTGVAQQGISLLYDVETSVDQANDQVIAVINAGHEAPVDPTVNPQLKAPLEGNLSGLMLLTRGEDHLSDYLFDADNPRGLVPFVIASANHSRYDTGSHIKSNGGLFTVGFSVNDDTWTWGAFVENGWDSYKTHNSFSDAATVNGRGHNRFNGVGVYGNYDFNNGWYADATLRGG